MSLSRILNTAIVVALAGASQAPAQDLHPSRRPSPTGIARISVGDAYLRVVYSRPYQRDRDNIFGTEESEALVPFGKIWRTGANEATEISVTKDVEIGGQKLPAGTYSVFSTPGAEQWQVHVNSALGLSGAYAPNPETGEYEMAYKAENNLVDVTATTETLEESVEQFTISFEKTDEGCDLLLDWITTRVRVPIKVAG